MIDRKMYLVNERVWYSTINLNGELSAMALMDWFQNLAYASAADIGHSVANLSKRHRSWLLASWNVRVNRYPKLDEKITIGTGPYCFKGILGYRGCCMWDENEELLAAADSQWFWFDSEKGKPARPDPGDFEIYTLTDPVDIEHEPRKIHLPEKMSPRPEIIVDWRYIDTNRHVNNSKYVAMALEALGEFWQPVHIRVEYIKAAVDKDIVIPLVGEREGRTVVNLSSPEGSSYAIVEFE